ncbi:DUF2842 domain-containing protein [Celeribacter sp. SCSIO 80788]|uniref:DUF2842 domain-containing protein n=1 Tax=Celeribacter sp. SCSIO 80788 TaxID=3117013 RepID=UPI003DA387C5
MALSYKARRRLALLVLVLGLPIYIVMAVTIMNWIDRPGLWIELGVYIGLGVLWAFPLKAVFKGIGQPDPDTSDDRSA